MRPGGSAQKSVPIAETSPTQGMHRPHGHEGKGMRWESKGEVGRVERGVVEGKARGGEG